MRINAARTATTIFGTLKSGSRCKMRVPDGRTALRGQLRRRKPVRLR
jgi:hypothetical protein